MYIYNEETHALRILRNKNFNTLRQQKQEKYALIKYLLSINKTDDEINKILKSIKNNQLSYINIEHHDKINYSMINRAKTMKFIRNVTIDISKEELDLIIELQDEILAKIMYANLIYYKYTTNYTTNYFISKKNNEKIFVKENENAILSLVGLSLKSKDAIREAYKILLDKGYYYIQNFKGANYYSLPLFKSDNIAFTIKNFDNVIKELLFYDNPTKYFRCEVCGKLIELKKKEKSGNRRLLCPGSDSTTTNI